MNQTNRYEVLMKNTCFISIGTFGSKLLTFVMVRFYTEVLTPSDYGTADLIIQSANLLVPLISMGIIEGVFRFALHDPSDRKNVFFAGFAVIAAGSALSVFLLSLLSIFLSVGVTGWLVCFYTAASCYHSLCSQFVRAQGKMALFAGQGLLNTVLMISLNLLFLLGFQWGVIGYVLSIALADILCGGFLFLKERLWKQLTFRMDRRIFGPMLRYSIPLIPTTIFWWITSVSDRYMITVFLGREANGLYMVACKIPTMLPLLSGIFLEAWQFSAVAEAEKGKREQIHFFSRIWNVFFSVMFLGSGLVVAFSQWEIQLLSAQEYYEAWRYIPVLSAAMLFSSFVTFLGSVYLVEKKSMQSFWTAMAGAGINLLFNGIFLFGGLGIQGAALATFLSYFLAFLLRVKDTRMLLPFRLYKGRFLLNLLILCVQIVSVLTMFPMWRAVEGICLLLMIGINWKAYDSVRKKIAG